jgi:hypothetical protein
LDLDDDVDAGIEG